jgi:hypothetical protein
VYYARNPGVRKRTPTFTFSTHVTVRERHRYKVPYNKVPIHKITNNKVPNNKVPKYQSS